MKSNFPNGISRSLTPTRFSPLAAYDQAIEASHLFNLLQARGVISVQERANYMARVRDLAKGSCKAWIDSQSERWARDYPEWVL
jgi:glycyl-tRNA synthetase alpha chain